MIGGRSKINNMSGKSQRITEDDNTDAEETDEEIQEIAEEYGVENDEAEEIQDIANDLGLDNDDAYMLWEEGI